MDEALDKVGMNLKPFVVLELCNNVRVVPLDEYLTSWVWDRWVIRWQGRATDRRTAFDASPDPNYEPQEQLK
jgi:hypothetical protein